MPLDRPAFHPFSITSSDRQRQVQVLEAKAQSLNAGLRHHGAADVMRAALDAAPKLVLVSSFGAESVVLLHLASMVRRDLPILFIDTQMLFAETLVYQQELTERLQLTNITILRSDHLAQEDPDGRLHQRDPDACCTLRKSLPLASALRGFDGWLTGRKRFQSGTRAALPHFEVETPEGEAPRLKINPLAHWGPADVATYIAENRLPRHPLVARGYPSIGCAPCTSPVAAGEDSRAGRWRGTTKDECGIHFRDGRLIRTGEKT